MIINQTTSILLSRRLIVDRGFISPCWEYTGCRNKKGYGVIRIFKKNWLVHKLVASICFKDYNPNLFTLHKCNNPPCFNDEHLKQGTNRENMLDAIERGTHVHSSKKFCPKGHPYDDNNTIIRTDKRGRQGRWCKQCEKDRIRS